ncbi:hypothetical protein BJ944DRAFT_252798 [Cunninghamella echinulata]|nr:hypothetical protein BJ944DRAFT_252798 [Cunninghamella echinulata]
MAFAAPVLGGSPNCIRCNKAVYMAEKVIGPGGAWHKNCLTCKECNKRLDSTTLTERNGEAYCKTCYTRQWGAKGYGFAGGASFLSTEEKLPREILESQNLLSSSSAISPSQKEVNSTPPPPPALPSSLSRPQLPTKPALPSRPNLPARSMNNNTITVNSPPPPIPDRSVQKNEVEIKEKEEDHINNVSFIKNESTMSRPNLPPRSTTPLSPTKKSYIINQTSYVPKKFNFTVQNDICTKCRKAVYAAELILGAGNKYHKYCLKCTECGKLLNSTNMQDRNSDIYCRGCYASLFGPKGYGYNGLLSTEGATR